MGTRSFFEHLRPASRTFSLIAILTAVAPTVADAGCGDRPGTPDLVGAYPRSATEIRYDWRSTERGFEGDRYYDIEVTDGAGQVQSQSRTGTGPYRANYRDWVFTTFTNVDPNREYCFRVRARTGPGTKGCVSKIWSGKVCTTTPTPEIDAICKNYTRTAYAQAMQVNAMLSSGECQWRDNPRWTANQDDHYKWCVFVRQQGKTTDVFESQERDRILKTVCKQKGQKGSGSGAGSSSSGSSPPNCNFTAVIANEACTNLDGTPSQILAPGGTTAAGCGPTKDAAIESAKSSFFTQACLAEDDEDVAGCCTYKVMSVSPGCNCMHLRSQQSKKCGGARPVGTWPYCCPKGSKFRSGFCQGVVQPGQPRKCPDGYRVLETPNKYGAYCEIIPVPTPQRECPDGYRVLETPNKYGAYCEIIPVPTPEAPPPPPTCDPPKILYQSGACGCPSGLKGPNCDELDVR